MEKAIAIKTTNLFQILLIKYDRCEWNNEKKKFGNSNQVCPTNNVFNAMLTDSWNSGSFADASQRFINIKTFGLESRFDTSWKNAFSASVIVDSAFSTSTKTSAFKQWLSIQSSRFGVTSTPGESTKTTSSRSKLHRSRGQNIRIFELSLSFSWHNAFASCLTSCNKRIDLNFENWFRKKPADRCSPWRWAFRRNLLSPNTLLCHRFLPLDRNSLLCVQCPMVKYDHVTLHWSQNSFHSMFDQRRQLSYDHDLILVEWLPLYAHNYWTDRLPLCPQLMFLLLRALEITKEILVFLPLLSSACHSPWTVNCDVSMTYSSISPKISLIFFLALTNIWSGEFS